MPLGVSRLLLSISAMKRTLAEVAGVDADYLLSQAGEILITERGELILANQSDFVTGDFIDPNISSLLTEAGETILTQNDGVLSTQQLFAVEEVGLNFIETQDGRTLSTQSGLLILHEESDLIGQFISGDFLQTQAEEIFLTQDGKSVLLDQSDLTGETVTGNALLTQDGNALASQNGDLIHHEKSRTA